MLTRSSSHSLDVRSLSAETLSPAGNSGVSGARQAYASVVAVLADFLSVFAGTAAAALGWQILRGMRIHNAPWLIFSVGLQYSLVVVLLAKAYHLYDHSPGMLQLRDTANVIRISVFSLIAVSVSVLYSRLVVPRSMLAAAWLFVTLLLILQKHLTRDLVTHLRSASAPRRRALIYGAGSDARRLYSCLANSKHLGVVPVGFVEANASKRAIYRHDYKHREFAPVFDSMPSDEKLASMGITDLFIAQASQSGETVSEVSAFAASRRLNLSFVGTAAPHYHDQPASVHVIDNLLITSYTSWESSTFFYDATKRAFDIMVASVLIVMSAPFWLAAALAVRFTSSGPIFFRQERIGRHGRPFEMLKFRSMYVNAPKYDRSPEDDHDPRITPAGRFLRKTSLDELPQLWNVLRGDMALVGPRPEMPYIVNNYNPQERVRLSVPQGMTGIWQLSADRKYAIHESIEYDLYYIENRGFFVDLAILAHTLLFAMKGV